jgi:hypothetical protein
MFEILEIKYLSHQPTAKITNKTLDRIIRREYCDNFKEVKQKLESISGDTLKGRNRLSAAVLKLSNRDLTKIDLYIEMCNYDFRDVVSQAEYSRSSKFGLGEIAPNKLKEVYLDDWEEYLNWLNKDW